MVSSELIAQVESVELGANNRPVAFALFEALEASDEYRAKIAEARERISKGLLTEADLYAWRVFDDSYSARALFSLDAALKLCERNTSLHPGIQKFADGWGAELVYPLPVRDYRGTSYAICSTTNRFPTPALALLSALLSALLPHPELSSEKE